MSTKTAAKAVMSNQRDGAARGLDALVAAPAGDLRVGNGESRLGGEDDHLFGDVAWMNFVRGGEFCAREGAQLFAVVLGEFFAREIGELEGGRNGHDAYS